MAVSAESLRNNIIRRTVDEIQISTLFRRLCFFSQRIRHTGPNIRASCPLYIGYFLLTIAGNKFRTKIRETVSGLSL